jgi:hypothetical protein
MDSRSGTHMEQEHNRCVHISQVSQCQHNRSRVLGLALNPKGCKGHAVLCFGWQGVTHRELRPDDVMHELSFQKRHDLLTLGQRRTVVSCSKHTQTTATTFTHRCHLRLERAGCGYDAALRTIMTAPSSSFGMAQPWSCLCFQQ